MSNHKYNYMFKCKFSSLCLRGKNRIKFLTKYGNIAVVFPVESHLKKMETLPKTVDRYGSLYVPFMRRNEFSLCVSCRCYVILMHSHFCHMSSLFMRKILLQCWDQMIWTVFVSWVESMEVRMQVILMILLKYCIFFTLSMLHLSSKVACMRTLLKQCVSFFHHGQFRICVFCYEEDFDCEMFKLYSLNKHELLQLTMINWATHIIFKSSF